MQYARGEERRTRMGGLQVPGSSARGGGDWTDGPAGSEMECSLYVCMYICMYLTYLAGVHRK